MVLTDPDYWLKPEQKLWLHAQFKRVCKGAIIVFMPPENQWVLPADQYLFWVKPTRTMNTTKSYGRFVEMLFVYNVTTWNNNRHWSQYQNVFWDLVDDTSVHQHRKPPSLIERLILNHTLVGDIILDPFAGSGVVADMAERHRRDYIAFDNTDYKRLP
jgi:hypothetical protein